jgi:TPR repeat protein
VVDVKSLFDYATSRVSLLRQQYVDEALSGGRSLTLSRVTAQQPRAYYGRETSAAFVVSKAPDWALLAAQEGDPAAMLALAFQYELGTNGQLDREEASRWRLKAAEAGDVSSLLEFAQRYGEGLSSPPDTLKSTMFLLKAVSGGSSFAARLVGDVLAAGGHEDAGARFYRRAAGAGDSGASAMLGWMYDVGKGVEKDPQRAVEWYRKGAERLDVIAMNNLGVCYFNGDGVPTNLVEAADWFRKAAKRGFGPAKANLAALEKQRRKSDGAILAPEVPRPLVTAIEVGWFSGYSPDKQERVWREKGNSDWWRYDNGLAFLKDGDFLLDGPPQKSRDTFTPTWVEQLKQLHFEVSFNDFGRAFFVRRGNSSGDMFATANVWQLDFDHTLFLPETRELKIQCRAAQECVFRYSYHKKPNAKPSAPQFEITVDGLVDFLTIPTEGEAMASVISSDLRKLAAKVDPAEPHIVPGMRWQPNSYYFPF